jgi:uncharacterized protein YdbL (DUF1318 family)
MASQVVRPPRREPGRVAASTLLSGMAAAAIGLVTAPALAQAVHAVASTGTEGSLESLGLGGVAVALSIWGMKESDKKRIDEAQRYAQDLKEQADLRLGEEREHHSAVERIYASKSETYQQLLEAYGIALQEKQRMIDKLLERVLDGRFTPPGSPT